MNSKYSAIQGGIYYSPNLHFYAFDISIIDSSILPSAEKYLDYEESLKAFKYSNILHAEPLGIYSAYCEALEFKLGFNTTIPKKFNLPEIKGNKAEGIVIKSSKGRFITKKKIPEFSETKYSENGYECDYCDQNDLINYKNESMKYITLNRLNNAISKVGPLETNKNEIYEVFVDDILYELNAFHINGLREWLIEHVTKLKNFD
jgi:hypothetical protein